MYFLSVGGHWNQNFKLPSVLELPVTDAQTWSPKKKNNKEVIQVLGDGRMRQQCPYSYMILVCHSQCHWLLLASYPGILLLDMHRDAYIRWQAFPMVTRCANPSSRSLLGGRREEVRGRGGLKSNSIVCTSRLLLVRFEHCRGDFPWTL